MEQQKRYISVLDIGTSKVLALIGEVQDDDKINIIGLGQASFTGLARGHGNQYRCHRPSHQAGGQ